MIAIQYNYYINNIIIHIYPGPYLLLAITISQFLQTQYKIPNQNQKQQQYDVTCNILRKTVACSNQEITQSEKEYNMLIEQKRKSTNYPLELSTTGTSKWQT